MKKFVTISRAAIATLVLWIALIMPAWLQGWLPGSPLGEKVAAQCCLPHNESGDAQTPAAEPKQHKDGKSEKDAKWDVEAEHGPSSMVEFDTDEGTWMNLDVSRDGK